MDSSNADADDTAAGDVAGGDTAGDAAGDAAGDDAAGDDPDVTAVGGESAGDSEDAPTTDAEGADDGDDELAELRDAVEDKYDFENFGPADMAQMSADEWEAAFDAETWITGEELIDRVVADLKGRIASREIFAVLEREGDQLLVYSDEGYAVVSPDGTVEGRGGTRRDVEPLVAMCSMDEYEVPDPPEDYQLPSPESVAEQTGEFGNLMVQIIAGMQLLCGVGLLGAWLATVAGLLETGVSTIIAPVVGGLFTVIGTGLFLLVANARLSDRFRAEQYRNRLRAVEVEGIERPDIELEGGPDGGVIEEPQGGDTDETKTA